MVRMKIKMMELFKLMLERKAPKKIRVLGIDMTFIKTAEWGDYKDDDGCRLSAFSLIDCLNEDVEIIEEPKKIEKIKSNGDEFYSDYIDTWISKNKTDAYCEFLMNKINELIDEINNLKEK